MNNIYSWQKEAWRRLAQDVQGSRRSSVHALLLRGRKGLGKLAFGRYLAKSRLCEHPSVEGEACQTCASCRWFEQGSHPDYRLIEPEAISAPSTMEAAISGRAPRLGPPRAPRQRPAVRNPGKNQANRSVSRKYGIWPISSIYPAIRTVIRSSCSIRRKP